MNIYSDWPFLGSTYQVIKKPYKELDLSLHRISLVTVVDKKLKTWIKRPCLTLLCFPAIKIMSKRNEVDSEEPKMNINESLRTRALKGEHLMSKEHFTS